MADTEKLRRLRTLATGSLAAVALTDALAIAAAIPYSSYLRSLPRQAVVADLEPVASEVFYGLVGLAQLLAFVGAAVCFVLWFHDVYGAVPAITGRATNHDRKWVFWGFVVPFLNIFRPQQMMRETWDVMLQRWLRDADGSPALVPADRVNIWWGLYIAMCVASYFSGRVAWLAVSAAENVFSTTLTQGADAISLVSAVVAIGLVRNVTRLQLLLLDQPAPSEAV